MKNIHDVNSNAMRIRLEKGEAACRETDNLARCSNKGRMYETSNPHYTLLEKTEQIQSEFTENLLVIKRENYLFLYSCCVRQQFKERSFI